MFRALTKFADGLAALAGFERRRAADAIIIRVGVSYRADPDQVRAVLSVAARECPHILATPAPSVAFDDFGPSSLEFSLHARCRDGVERGAAETDLRTRILKAFRMAGIEMPYAQYDIHLRDLDAVRVILNRVAEERAGRQGVNGEAESASMPEASPADPRRRAP
jgi:small-conductance mechanosensitive channel